MTNAHLTKRETETTSASDLQPEARRRRVRHVAVIHADGSRFRIVAAPVKLVPSHP